MLGVRFPATMPATRTASFLQTISHILVVGAGVLYLFGFIVVSAFDASWPSVRSVLLTMYVPIVVTGISLWLFGFFLGLRLYGIPVYSAGLFLIWLGYDRLLNRLRTGST